MKQKIQVQFLIYQQQYEEWGLGVDKCVEFGYESKTTTTTCKKWCCINDKKKLKKLKNNILPHISA